ncbi:MAG: dockerin type I domain-containing protein, partial [Verrucomicrobiota bacterium]|nr:dockerin type I domain-containing protein [Verrucomicrobiota bacterium]
NDGNVWVGFNLGTGTAGQANWVDVTAANAVLPNRPILNIALDPSAASADSPTGYAAVGGFNEGTPTTPGHLFKLVCGSTCGSIAWQDKSGNLPNIPVDSVAVNPNFPRQVFAGTDIGLYYTDDITVGSPVWYRFNNGLPNVMIWDMQIDRGSTTLSLWTRGRGAYAWPLPTGPIQVQLNLLASRKTHGSAGTFDIPLPLDGSGIEPRDGGPNGNYTLVFTFPFPLSSVSGARASSGSVSSSEIGSNPKEYLVNLTGITTAQSVTVTLSDVQDNSGHFSNSLAASFNVLVGDVNTDRFVNSGDVLGVRSHSGETTTAATAPFDVTADGSINSSDVLAVRSHSGEWLGSSAAETPPAPKK